MSNPSETQILHIPSPSSSEDHSTRSYNVWLAGNDSRMSAFSVLDDFAGDSFLRSSEFIGRKPLEIRRDIDINKWKESLRYDDRQVENLIKEILIDFGIDTSPEYVEWVRKDVRDFILLYEKKYDVQLSEEMRSALQRLALRMAYDRICLRSSI